MTHPEAGAPHDATGEPHEEVYRRRRLLDLSRRLLESGRYVALEGDRWFVGAVRTADLGARQTKLRLDQLGRYVWTESARLRPSWLRRADARERIRKTVLSEAKRAELDVPKTRVEEFADQMSLLIDLVLSGAIDIDAIAFEAEPIEGETGTARDEGDESPSTGER